LIGDPTVAYRECRRRQSTTTTIAIAIAIAIAMETRRACVGFAVSRSRGRDCG